MDKKIIKFDDTNIEIYKYHQQRGPTLIDNIDVRKIGLSNKISFGKKLFKYFISYKEAKKLELYAYSFQK